MTIECMGSYIGGNIKLDDPTRLDPMKVKLTEGDPVLVTFESRFVRASDDAFEYFHVLRDRYAKKLGMSMNTAKLELKYKYGVWMPYREGFVPPLWKRAKFVEIGGEFVYMKSTLDYTKAEMSDLIEGTINACFENQVDIDDLIMNYGKPGK